MVVARQHQRLRLQIDRDDVQRGRNLARTVRVQIIVRGAGGGAIAHPLGQQGEGFARHHIADGLGALARTLPIHHDERQSAAGTLDHLDGIAAFRRGVFASFGNGDV